MKFYMPTKVYAENECVKNHGSELSSLGTHALIVTGKNSSKKNHSLDDVLEVLEANSVKYTVFDNVEENPSVETVMAARELGLENNADFVIGIGGGSPIDAAKAAALMLKNPHKPWQFLYENTPSESLSLAAVPTTCGTGSEVTGVSVLTRHDLKTKVSAKHKIYPNLALIDGKYLIGAPRSIIVNTAIDALSHLIESAVNTLADTYSDMTAYEGLRQWSRCRNIIVGKEELNTENALTLMNSSALAGMSIAQTGTTIPHALSYILTYRGNVPHGAAVGIFQPNYLRFAEKELVNRVLTAAGFASLDEFDSFIHNLVPVSVDAKLLEDTAASVLAKPDKLVLCPYKTDEKIMAELIKI